MTLRRLAVPLVASAVLSLAVAGPTYGMPDGAADRAAADPPCRLGLALSGGGARGVAHIGALRAFEEAGIRVDCIAGTSIGALMGALWAAGHDSAEIEQIVRNAHWAGLSRLAASRRQVERSLVPLAFREDRAEPLLHLDVGLHGVSLHSSAFGDYRINRLLFEQLADASVRAGRDFSRLPVPFRAVATDLRTGERVVLRSGDLGRAVRGSLSVPLALPPVEIEGRLLVDGGFVDNLPVDVAFEMGASQVVAVDVTSPMQPGDQIERDVISVVSQLSDVLSRVGNRQHWREPDLHIEPGLEGHGFNDYTDFDFLIRRGYEATRAALHEGALEAGPAGASGSVGGPPAGGTPPTSTSDRPAAPGLTARTLTGIRVAGNHRVADFHIVRDLGLRVGRPFRLQEALHGLDLVFASGLFRTAWLDVLPDGDDGAVLVVNVVEEHVVTLELGAAFNDEDQFIGRVRLQGHDLLGTGEVLGADARGSDREAGLTVAYHTQNQLRRGLGFRLAADVVRDKPRFFVGGDFVNRAEFFRTGLEGAVDASPTRATRFEAGFRIAEVDVRERLGLDFGPGESQLRLARLRFDLDTLDDARAPTRGAQVELVVERNLPSLGASSRYWRARLAARTPVALWPRHVVEPRVFAGLSTGTLPIHEQFRVGGPDLVPGLHRQELWDDQALAGALSYSFHPASGLQLIGTVGAGGAWQRIDEIALDGLTWGAGVGLRYATPVGPIILGYGVTDGGGGELYFGIGYQ